MHHHWQRTHKCTLLVKATCLGYSISSAWSLCSTKNQPLLCRLEAAWQPKYHILKCMVYFISHWIKQIYFQLSEKCLILDTIIDQANNPSIQSIQCTHTVHLNICTVYSICSLLQENMRKILYFLNTKAYKLFLVDTLNKSMNLKKSITWDL